MTPTIMLTQLPGPDRKRTGQWYQFRITHQDADPAAGCAAVWEVAGGREAYQIAVERTPAGLHWHCTCADAVYRGALDPRHQCKHVRGLLGLAVAGGPAPRAGAVRLAA